MNVIKISHYSALILGFQVSLFFAFFLITEAIVYLFEGKISMIPLILMMIFSVGSYIWEVIKPGKGKIMMVIGGFALVLYMILLGGIDEYKMALIYGLPFVIPGSILFFTTKRI